ncbi:MAG: hypothetical protein KF753_19745, partial [Caldilineaceae bacterium]|nr:hypothetical protein [Caldilineaceae bacterium]
MPNCFGHNTNGLWRSHYFVLRGRAAGAISALIFTLLLLLWGGRVYAATPSPGPIALDPTTTQYTAGTIISSDITADQTWTVAGSPYTINQSVAVQPDVTLTVQPGVEVRLGEGVGLKVRGTLTAIGTPSQPITFTGTTAQPGWWDDIYIQGLPTPTDGSQLSYVTLQYGGYYDANLLVDNSH